MVDEPRCQGCDKPLPPPRPRGRRRKWCSDKCRRETSYGGRCVDCGARTNGNDGPGTAAEYCSPCSNRNRTKWTRDACIEAIRRFHAEYGRVPRVQDFSISFRGVPGRRPPGSVGEWPQYLTLYTMFGGFPAAVRAAGLEPFDHSRDHAWSTGRPIYPKQEEKPDG